MGKASSAKKVARAARAGESSTTSERRELGFPAIVAVVLILGLLLVAFARQTRDAEVRPTLADHWHAGYGIYDCTTGTFAAPIQSEFDPDGIHSHQDGVIHIHPFSASVTGSKATLGAFLDAMFAEVTTEGIEVTGGAMLTAGTECDGEPAIIQVHRWANAFDPGEPDVFTDNFDDIRLSDDGGFFTIALAPAGAELPINEAAVTALTATMGSELESAGRNLTELPPVQGPSDFGEDTAVVDGNAGTDGADEAEPADEPADDEEPEGEDEG